MIKNVYLGHGGYGQPIYLRRDGTVSEQAEEERQRPSWDETFMAVAEVMARRSTCDRAQVGAVAVLGQRLIAEGYNGALAGMPHCDEVGHDMLDGHCVRAVHAEQNLVTQNVDLSGATVYTTHSACWPCFRLLVAAGVDEIVYRVPYRQDEDTTRIAAVVNASVKRGFRIIQLRRYKGR